MNKVSPTHTYFSNGNILTTTHFNNEDKLHNENGPALINYHENGNKYCEEYRINGNLHNENGPADILYFENGNKDREIFYLNHKIHNLNGPAHISYIQNGEIDFKEYWLNGEFICVDSDEEFQEYLKLNNIK